MRRSLAAVAIAATIWSPSTAAAQDAAGPRAAVDQLFEGMRTADAGKVRAVLAPGARFTVLSQRDGPVTVVAQSVEGWVRSIGSSEGRWDERVYDVQVSVDGPMASVWAPYTFYLDGAISHCGINSIELLRDAEGWKITQISDTRRREGCPDPRGG
jgi:hypothetical protein